MLAVALVIAIIIAIELTAGRATCSAQAPSAGTPATVALSPWLARLRRAGPDAGTVIAGIDPQYDPQLTAGLPFAAVEVFRGQLDDDAQLEAVVQVRYHAAGYEAGMQRSEAFWVGIFDPTPQGARLVGAIRERAEHCNFDDAPLALLLRFVRARPVLRVRIQRTGGCGTLVAFDLEVTEYRLRDGQLEARAVPPPEGMNHDRLASPAF